MMPIEFRCSHCNRRLSIGRRKAGSHTACPRCNNNVQVPLESADNSSPSHHTSSYESDSLAVDLSELIQQKKDSPKPLVIPTSSVRPSLVLVTGATSTAICLGIGLIVWSMFYSKHRDQFARVDALQQTSVNLEPSINTEPLINTEPSIIEEPVAVESKTEEQSSSETSEPTPSVTIPSTPDVRVEDIPNVGFLPSDKTLAASIDAIRMEPEEEEPDLGAIDEKPQEQEPLVVNIRKVRDEEELREQLNSIKELSLDLPNQQTAVNIIAGRDTTSKFLTPLNVQNLAKELLSRKPSLENTFNLDSFAKKVSNHPSLLMIGSRPDLAGLPLQMGDDCMRGRQASSDLDLLSKTLRRKLHESRQSSSTGRFSRASSLSEIFKSKLLDEKERSEWLTPDAIPTLQQLLMAEDTEMRLVLVDILANIPGKRSTEALAQHALFDLSKTVRDRALDELQARDIKEYQQPILDGFRYPLASVSANAADAVIALKMKSAVPSLGKLLLEPDPDKPQYRNDKSNEIVVREVVRVNHLGNCLMCHAPSFETRDLVRGAIPNRGQTIESLSSASSTPFYNGCGFVRADITYLRQDFSVMQPVENPNNWPSNQRFDYMVRTRHAFSDEIANFGSPEMQPQVPSEYKESILFALQELTGEKNRITVQDWRSHFGKPKQSSKHKRS